MYWLYLWIAGCVGLECPIQEWEKQEFNSLAECEKALEVVINVGKVTNKRYQGICMPESAHTRIMEGKEQK